MNRRIKEVIRILRLSAIGTAVLLAASVVINHAILLVAFVLRSCVNSLSATVYTFVLCPLFVLPIGFLITVGMTIFIKNKTPKVQLLFLLPLILIMAFLQLIWFPIEHVGNSENAKLPSLEEYLMRERTNDRPCTSSVP